VIEREKYNLVVFSPEKSKAGKKIRNLKKSSESASQEQEEDQKQQDEVSVSVTYLGYLVVDLR
jgi:hypothetical protein